MALSDTTRRQLMGVSTATLCTALFKRGLRNAFIQDVHPLNPALPNMVGEAFTLRGGISGIVSDPSQSVMPGVAVTLRSSSAGMALEGSPLEGATSPRPRAQRVSATIVTIRMTNVTRKPGLMAH